MTAILAIVPVKSLARAKRRLAPALEAAQRRRLVLTMLEEVLLCLALARHSGALAGILVVTPDADVASLAEARGAEVLREDRAHGLNAAVRAGLAYARSRGKGAALVIPADVPLATFAELDAVIGSLSPSARPQAVLVPSADGAGTNALLLGPTDAMQPEFGPDSFVRHVAQATARGLDFRVLRLAGLAADIDQPGDLARLLEATRGSDRYAFLEAPRRRSATREREA